MGAVIACFWVLMAASVYLMIRRSTRMMYDGVFDAVLGVFDLEFLDLGALLFVPGVVGALLGGGMVAGALARGAIAALVMTVIALTGLWGARC